MPINLPEIESRGNTVVLRLDKRFYDAASVRSCMDDFSDVCEGSLNDGDSLEITLECGDGQDPEMLGCEFCNYLLAFMKSGNIV